MMAEFFHFSAPHGLEVGSIYGLEEWDHQFSRAQWAECMDLPSIKCPVFPGHQRAGDREMDLTVVLDSPRIGDFIWTEVSECLLTERTLRLFRDAGLTGFQTRPVTIERVKRVMRNSQVEIPTLFELKVTGIAGHAHKSSGIRVYDRCDVCGWIGYSSYKKGLIVDESQWDGSDFVTTIEYHAMIMVTEKVKSLIISNELKPCVLTPAKAMRWPAGLIRPEGGWFSDLLTSFELKRELRKRT